MPVPPRQLPSGLDDTFACADARAAGASRTRLRAADLDAPFRGVRRRIDPRPPDDEPYARGRAERARVTSLARAYAKVMPERAFFAGRTAAMLYGMPIDHGEAIEVAELTPGRAPRAAGVRGRTIAPALASIGTLEGLRVSSPASTWAMLAGALTVRQLIHAGDALVLIPRDDHGRPQPHLQRATIGELVAAAHAPGRRARARLLGALEEIRVGAMSPLESDYRVDARRAGLPEPALDVEIRTPRGRLLGIADAAYPTYRVLVEVEGEHHRVDRRQWQRDIDKHAAYAAHGWELVRLTAGHIRGRVPTASGIVADTLTRRGWRK